MLVREISPIKRRQYYNSPTPGSPASTSDTRNLPGSIDYQPSEVDMDGMPEAIFDDDDEPLERKKTPLEAILDDEPLESVKKVRYSIRNKDKC